MNYDFDNEFDLLSIVKPSRVFGLVGTRGSGKTNLATAIAKEFSDSGFSIWSNYHLIDIPFKKLTKEIMLTLPPELTNAVILIDEIHVWADAYRFWSKTSNALTMLITQLRKRKIIFIYTTQYEEQIAKRIRKGTDYLITCFQMNRNLEFAHLPEGYLNLYVLDVQDPYATPVKIAFDGRDYFKYYDTDEVITDEGI